MHGVRGVDRGPDAVLARGAGEVERMDLGGRAAPGVVFHWSAVTEDGVHAVDVYESRAAADALAGEKIGPLAAELGLDMPAIREYAVHATLA